MSFFRSPPTGLLLFVGGSPPTGLFVGATALASLLALYEASALGISFTVVAILALSWLVLTISWLVRLSVALWRQQAAAHWARWMLPAVLALATVLLIDSEAPMHARFAVSEPSLERFARSVRTEYHSSRLVGLYSVTSVEPIPGGARFIVSPDTWDWKSYGFAYSPDRVPTYEDGTYEHFTGPWYIWIEGI
jgi:hypothetical protein